MMWIGLYLLIGLALSLLVVLYIGIQYGSFLNFAKERQLSEDTLCSLRENPTMMGIVVIIVIIFLWPYITYKTLIGEKS